MKGVLNHLFLLLASFMFSVGYADIIVQEDPAVTQSLKDLATSVNKNLQSAGANYSLSSIEIYKVNSFSGLKLLNDLPGGLQHLQDSQWVSNDDRRVSPQGQGNTLTYIFDQVDGGISTVGADKPPTSINFTAGQVSEALERAVNVWRSGIPCKNNRNYSGPPVCFANEAT